MELFQYMHWGRIFIKIAGNSNFNYLLNAFLLIFASIVHMRVFPPFLSRPLRMLSLSRICCYSVIVFLNFVFSLSWKWSQTLFMLELKQPYYDHLVIQSKKLLNFLTRRYVGWTSGRKESASKTNQEADDRLCWPMLLENQSRKRSTNGTIQQGRLPRIFSRKILKFRA